MAVKFNLQGYACERKDRIDRNGGGVAFYIKSNLRCKRRQDLEGPLEIIWVRICAKFMPRKCPYIVMGSMYHPPDSDNRQMRDYLSSCIDSIFQKQPDAGILIMGDFNRLHDGFMSHYGFKQVVSGATRHSATLDKIFTNVSELYEDVKILDPIGPLTSIWCCTEPLVIPTLILVRPRLRTAGL